MSLFGSANLYMAQGSSFSSNVILTNSDGSAANTSGMSNVASVLKRTYTSSNTWSLSCNLNSNGILNLSANSTETANIPGGNFEYDVVAISGGDYVRVIEGIVFVDVQMTPTVNGSNWAEIPSTQNVYASNTDTANVVWI